MHLQFLVLNQSYQWYYPENAFRPLFVLSDSFTVSRLVQSLMMIEAVEAINNSSMLNNLTLGYNILDTCSDVTTALQQANVFMERFSCNNSKYQAVIGEFHSEVSIAVAQLLTIVYMPQVAMFYLIVLQNAIFWSICHQCSYYDHRLVMDQQLGF